MPSRFIDPEVPPSPGRHSTKRVALVVGNGAYRSSALQNPPKDAARITAALAGLGFQTDTRTNVGKQALEEAIVNWGRLVEEAGSGGVGFFYFAGHGIQHDGVNYMVPVGTTISDARSLASGAVPVDFLIKQLARKPCDAAVIVLDACRDNRLVGTGGGYMSGLAAIHNLPRGTIVAFATAAGQVADDGGGDNSPYAVALARRLEEPGQQLDRLFNLVAQDVEEATTGQQTPALFVQGAVPRVALQAGAELPPEASAQSAPEPSPKPLPVPVPWPVRYKRALMAAGGLVAVAAAAVAAFLLLRPVEPPTEAGGINWKDPATWPVGPDTAVLWKRDEAAGCPPAWTKTRWGCLHTSRRGLTVVSPPITDLALLPDSSRMYGRSGIGLLLQESAVVMVIRSKLGSTCLSEDFESGTFCLEIIKTPPTGKFTSVQFRGRGGCEPKEVTLPLTGYCLAGSPGGIESWQLSQYAGTRLFLSGDTAFMVVVGVREGSFCPAGSLFENARYCLIKF